MNHQPTPHKPESAGNPQREAPDFWRTRYAVGFVVIGAVAGYYLLTEHLAHVVGALPYLLLLSCPLMHFFMHGKHGGHGGHDHGDHPSDKQGPAKPGDSS